MNARGQKEPFLLVLLAGVGALVLTTVVVMGIDADPTTFEAAAEQTETGSTGAPLVTIPVAAVLAVAVGAVVSVVKRTEDGENE